MTELNAAQKTALFEQACDAELGFLIEKYGFRLVADNGEEFARLTGSVIGDSDNEVVMGRVYRGRDTAVTFQLLNDGMRDKAEIDATLYGVRDGEYPPAEFRNALVLRVGPLYSYVKKKPVYGEVVTLRQKEIAESLEANKMDFQLALAEAQRRRYRKALRKIASGLEEVAAEVLRGNHDLIREVWASYGF